jgi:hypothetical protein
MDELRFMAAFLVRESDISKAAKLQIINFLENEASDAQVMVLLLDGEVQALDEMAENIVYDRWDAAMLSEKGRILRKLKRKAKVFAADPLYSKRSKQALARAQKATKKVIERPSGKTLTTYARAAAKARKAGLKTATRHGVATGGAYGGVVYGGSHVLCKNRHPNNKKAYKKCMWGEKQKPKKKK